LILIILVGIIGFFSVYMAVEVKSGFGIAPNQYLIIGLGIMFGLMFLTPIIFLIPVGSKK